MRTFFLCAVFYINHMCDHRLFSASTFGTIPPQGPPLWNIYVIMSSEPANEAADIPFFEGVQETYLNDSDAEVVKGLDPEDSEAGLFQLGGDSDHSKEPPGKDMEKDNHSKKRRMGEK